MEFQLGQPRAIKRGQRTLSSIIIRFSSCCRSYSIRLSNTIRFPVCISALSLASQLTSSPRSLHQFNFPASFCKSFEKMIESVLKPLESREKLSEKLLRTNYKRFFSKSYASIKLEINLHPHCNCI